MTINDSEDKELPNISIEDSGPSIPSRAAKKRSMDELLRLVLFLVDISQGDLDALDLSDDLLGPLSDARKIKAHGARRRQIRYVIQILASGDVEAVKAKIAGMKQLRDARISNFHAIEALRDRVLVGGDEALQEVVERFPSVDRQQLRNLQRAALKIKGPGIEPKASRAIFRFLQILFETAEKDEGLE